MPPLQCGLADRALKAGQPALACARLEEALQLLTEAPAAVGGGGVLRGRGPGGVQVRGSPAAGIGPAGRLQEGLRLGALDAARRAGISGSCQQTRCAAKTPHLKLPTTPPRLPQAGERQLAPRLQSDIRRALAEYQPDAVADYLQASACLF